MRTASDCDRPFSIGSPFDRPWPRLAMRLATPFIERVLGLSDLNTLYTSEWLPRRGSPHFCEQALSILGIRSDVELDADASWPVEGGLIVVANHPHGALDGLVIAAALERVRSDVRLLGNRLLGRIPELRDLCFLVDVFDEGESVRANATALRDAVRWVTGGGALVVFPAGEVSHAETGEGRVTDAPWHATIARLAERTGAAVLPVFIDGDNSRAFRLAGRVHPLLRTALLPRELLRQRGRTVRVVVGRPIPWSRLEQLPDPRSRTSYLRLRVYALARSSVRQAAERTRGPHPVAAPVDPGRLADDVASLPAERRLLVSGDYQVFCARARELPSVLLEIGRLREATFRAAGEGTSRSCDLDAFDRAYWHLFVWNDSRREIAGAYRVGPTDELAGALGPHGLYTRRLFRYGRRFLRELGPALELGRSFVRQEYQRDYATLMLLWKGIGRLVERAPRYRMLFGPVSISADYSDVSRELLVGVLSASRYQSPLARLVRPRRPQRLSVTTGFPDSGSCELLGADAINGVLAELEGDGKGMPVLLRQYLKLNARLLGFSLDPGFGHVVDGLMVVDLVNVELPVLQRYLGKEGAARLLAAHRQPASRVPGASTAAVPA